MKKILIIIVLLVVALFATNPDIEKFYQKALRQELKVGDEWFAKAKYGLIDAKYDYSNYYLAGVMRNRINKKITYIGVFNQVISIDTDAFLDLAD